MRFSNLNDWLSWQESLHSQEIDLGLERLFQVLPRLFPELGDLTPGSQQLPFHLITVGGTNGKGSSVAILESILKAADYRVGCYTSPHFLNYNERIKLSGQMIDDQSLCQAFEAIDQARGPTSLSYFEFSTLAAIYCFIQAKCDVVVLEVGLGGRLDAVNILDADVALVTTVDLDHQDWLGNDIETIAFEKAGIYRHNKVAIYGDENIPQSLAEHARSIGAISYQYGQDYGFERHGDSWDWECESLNCHWQNLPNPGLAGDLQFKNAANVLMILASHPKLNKINQEAIAQGLINSHLIGRYQLMDFGENKADYPQVLLDVAHNPQAARELAQYLKQNPVKGRQVAIFAALGDKDIAGVLAPMINLVDEWYVVDLSSDVYHARMISPENITSQIKSHSKTIECSCYNHFSQAFEQFLASKNGHASTDKSQDRVIVFGSFYTLAQALNYFETN